MATYSQHLARLFSGKGQIFSHEGTSQYSQNSPSGCGLAAFNCARILFSWDKRNLSTEDIINRLAAKATALEVVSLCADAKIPQHMEPEDFQSLPLFQASLTLMNTDYCMPTLDRIENLLRRLTEFDQSNSMKRRICAVIITRPPEIVVCFKIPHPRTDIYTLYDSHSRPRHPMGSAFVCTPDVKHLSRFVHDLLRVDEGLINGDTDVGWEGQLLASMSGHFFVPSEENFPDTPFARQILLDATMKQLSLQAVSKEHDAIVAAIRENAQRVERELNARVVQLQEAVETMRRDMDGWQRDFGRHRPETRSPRPIAVIHHQTYYTADHFEPAYNQRAGFQDEVGEDYGLSIQRQIEAQIQADRAAESMRRDTGGYGHTSPAPLHSSQGNPIISVQPGRAQHTGHSYHAVSMPGEWDSPVGVTHSPRGVFDMSEVRQAIDMQRMAEQQVQQTARNLPMAPAPVRAVPTRALTVEERYQRAEEEERLREEERLMRNRAEDAAAAAALARQFEEEEERIRREHEELMSNVQKIFECSVCMDEHPEEDLACVEMCGHKFGRECLRDFIISKIDQRSYPIVCPVCIAEQNRNGGRERVGTISNALAEMVGIEEEKYQAFIESQLASLAVQITCKKCNQQFFFDRDQFQEQKIVECLLPNCDHRWCKACNQEVPCPAGSAEEPEHSCDGSKELDRLLEGQGWKRCPGCQTPIERTHGCNHMTCRTPGCNMHFCYRCGATIGRADPGIDINPAYKRHYETCALFG